MRFFVAVVVACVGLIAGDAVAGHGPPPRTVGRAVGAREQRLRIEVRSLRAAAKRLIQRGPEARALRRKILSRLRKVERRLSAPRRMLN
jgi:hypothetical protein